eukprot:scaffold290782_cov15-Tisochrysis_lutea.AAC.1
MRFAVPLWSKVLCYAGTSLGKCWEDVDVKLAPDYERSRTSASLLWSCDSVELLQCLILRGTLGVRAG